MDEVMELHYHEASGMYVVEEHTVPVHIHTIRLERALKKVIDDGFEAMKGRLINIHV